MTILESINNLFPPEVQSLIYYGEAPTDVDNCIWLEESGGMPKNHFVKDILQKPYVTLFVRHQIYDTGHSWISLSKKLLSQYVDACIGIVLVGDIVYIGRDETRRNIWRLLFKIMY